MEYNDKRSKENKQKMSKGWNYFCKLRELWPPCHFCWGDFDHPVFSVEGVLNTLSFLLRGFWTLCHFWVKGVLIEGILSVSHNFVKSQERVMSSCLAVGLMVTNKYVKFQSNAWKGIQNKWGGTKNLTEILCRKRGINIIYIKNKHKWNRQFVPVNERLFFFIYFTCNHRKIIFSTCGVAIACHSWK